MQTLHETELSYTQDHKLDLNGMARTLLEDLVNTVMVEQVEELGCVRNGYRERKLVTSVGTLTLKIPKLREGTYFPDNIVSKWIRTNNLCERLNKEIKKRTRVVGVFPSKQAMLRLVGAVCINQNEEWFVATHFMDKRSLLFEEPPKKGSCTQETINHLLQVIDSDFKVCREVA